MTLNEARATVERTKAAMEQAAKGSDAELIKKCVAEHQLAKAHLTVAEAEAPKAPALHLRDVKKSADGVNLIVAKAVSAVVAKHESISLQAAAERVYGADADVTKAAIAPTVGARDQAGFAAEILQPQVAAFQSLLLPSSVYAGAMAGALSLDMVNGSVIIPTRDAAVKAVDKTNARKERAPIKAQSFGLKTATKTGSLLGSILSCSRELLDARAYANVQALIQQAIQEDLTQTVDGLFLAATATTDAPDGILVGVTAANIGTTGADIQTGLAEALGTAMDAPNNFALNDLKILINPKTKLKLQIMANALGQILFPEMAAGRLMGVQLVVSGNVPADQLVVIHSPSLYQGNGGVAIDTSDAAVYFDSADKPVSLWANNLVGFRMRTSLAWGSWRDHAVSLLKLATKA